MFSFSRLVAYFHDMMAALYHLFSVICTVFIPSRLGAHVQKLQLVAYNGCEPGENDMCESKKCGGSCDGCDVATSADEREPLLGDESEELQLASWKLVGTIDEMTDYLLDMTRATRDTHMLPHLPDRIAILENIAKSLANAGIEIGNELALLKQDVVDECSELGVDATPMLQFEELPSETETLPPGLTELDIN